MGNPNDVGFPGGRDPGAHDPKPRKRDERLRAPLWDQFKPWMLWVALAACAAGAAAVVVF